MGALVRDGVLDANPSSLHSAGRAAGRLVREASDALKQAFGERPFAWASSGSDAALCAGVHGSSVGAVWWRTALEHDCLRGRAAAWEVPALPSGLLDLDAFEKRLRDTPEAQKPRVLSVLWVHNETGVIQNLAELRKRLVRWSPETWLHVDASQAWGKLPLDPAWEHADTASFSGHKIGALAGIGVWVAASERARAYPLPSESGTPNLPAMASLGWAAAGVEFLLAKQPEIRAVRDRMESAVRDRLGSGVRIAGAEAPRVANTSLMTFAGVRGRVVADALDLEGICVGTGSACRSGIAEASPSLLAMGWESGMAQTATRLSMHRVLEASEETRVIDAVVRAVVRSHRA